MSNGSNRVKPFFFFTFADSYFAVYMLHQSQRCVEFTFNTLVHLIRYFKTFTHSIAVHMGHFHFY